MLFRSIPVVLLILGMQIALIAATSRASSDSSNCVSSEISSIDTGSLVGIAELNSTFQTLSLGRDYSFQGLGIQAGATCSPILMFSSGGGGSIEVLFSSVNSVTAVRYLPPSNFTATGSSLSWAGAESYRCPSSGCGKVTLAADQLDFTVPSFQKPSQYENSNCCADGLWPGMGDASGAGDNVLTQGGVLLWGDHLSYSGYSSPAFFYQNGALSTAQLWTSTCLYVNSGDSVNVTIDYGKFGSGGSYDIQMVYGDNDAKSTCAVYWFLQYSITPTYAYYIYEAPVYSQCSYGVLIGPGYCQTIQFNTIKYTGYVKYPGAGWDGFQGPPSGKYSTYTQYIGFWYIYQGTTNVDVDGTHGGYTWLQLDWVSSQQK